MARPKKLYLVGTLLNLPHPFEEDVQFLVNATYGLLCEDIARKEAPAITEAEKIADSREAGAEIQWVKSNADDLRRGARSVAVVTLVTRFQHWLRVFVEDMKKKPANGVGKNLATLNEGLGEGPVPAAFSPRFGDSARLDHSRRLERGMDARQGAKERPAEISRSQLGTPVKV